MKINTIFHIFVIFISLFMFNMPRIGIAQEASEIERAAEDARRDAEQNVSPIAWGSVGFLCGCFAPASAYFVMPEIPVGALLGKTPTYVDTYTRVYQQDAKRRRIQASVIGCAIGSAVNTAAYYLFVLPQLDTLTTY